MGAALLMGKNKQKPGVKLNPAFHKKLKLVADDAGLDMGDLIEREMQEFVNREAKRIAGEILRDPDPQQPPPKPKEG